MSLIRKTDLASYTKQMNIQEAVFNNFIFVGSLTEVLNQNIQLSGSFPPESVCKNFNDYSNETGEILGISQWYKDPTSLIYSELDEFSISQIGNLTSMHYIWSNMIDDSFFDSTGLYESIYYAFQEQRMFIQYPVRQTGIFQNWTIRDPCEYFESGVMDIFDAR